MSTQHDKSQPTSKGRRVGAWIWRWPLSTWAMGALVLLVGLGVVRAEYDSPPFGILVITESVWAWMYWAPSELLFELNGGGAVAGHDLISAIAGLSIAAIADILFATLRSRLTRVANK